MALRPLPPLARLIVAALGCAVHACTMAGCAMPGSSPWGANCPYGNCGQPVAESRSAEVPPGSQDVQHDLTIRSQSPSYGDPYSTYPSATGPGGYPRAPQPVSGGAPTTYVPGGYPPPVVPPLGTGVQAAPQPTVTYQQPGAAAPQFTPPPLPPPPGMTVPNATVPNASVPNVTVPNVTVPGQPTTTYPFYPPYPGFTPPSNFDPQFSATPTPLDIFVEETRTGRFMFGVTVNSDAGVAGQITIDERHFDLMNPPTSWDDFLEGRAWRGGGQGFRIEAQPGDQVQRYLISFTEPYFNGTNISFSASAFYYDRNFFDWDESRYGGRLMWGYRLTPDLSLSAAIRAENINLYDPRVLVVDELNEALGKNDLFSGRFTLTHDTRDLPFMPTEGHLIELAYEQAFGSFDYPRGEIDYSQYFLVRQRPDSSGRHTLAFSTRVGFTGSDTPIFENYQAGGFSTLRGFAFRGASPVDSTVRVGGHFRWLNSLEYFFPITADDMIKGTFFCDFGTVERDITIDADNFRVAPGFGLRINVPALGPAPLAFDFAFPVASAATDDEQTFSFFFGAMR